MRILTLYEMRDDLGNLKTRGTYKHCFERLEKFIGSRELPPNWSITPYVIDLDFHIK